MNKKEFKPTESRELRDELEVPGHVLMIKMKQRSEKTIKIIKEGEEIITWAEEHGMKKLRELPEDKKQRLREIFDILKLPHDNLD